ncbi:MAG: replicative DNA helicase [Patescibacteria group bacterium]|nr:replicative DNA helicase [Patescibacteria group bacterium]
MAKEDIHIPPQNLEAEVSLLGSILLDKEAIVKVADIVIASDFYKDAHGDIYQAMLKLYEHREPIDVVTLTNKLEESKKLEQIGGSSYIATLASSVPSAAHITNYARIVSGKSLLRRLIRASTEIADLAMKEDDEITNILDKSEQAVFKVSQKHLKENFIPIKDVLTESFDRIDELHKDKGSIRGVPTGFKDLDNLLAGLQPSDLVILAARPSMGKTSLALNMAQHIATVEGIPVAIFSLEMSKEQLSDRLICNEAHLDSWKLRTGNLDDADFPKIGQAMATLAEAPLWIDDSSGINVLEMRTKARRLQAEHGLGLVVVDYIQLIQGNGSSNRVEEVSDISRSLKGLARELNVPVVALSQLSRAVENRPSRIPQLADLRESGSIEQDADVVMFIYREDYYEQDTERKNTADILIRKHRNGPTGQIELYFKPEQMRFTTVDKKRETISV